MILNWKSTSYTAEQATSDNTAVAALHSNNISLSAKKVQYRNPERVIQYFLKDGFTSGPVTIPYFDVHTKM